MRSFQRTHRRVKAPGASALAELLQARRHETVRDLQQRVRDARAEWSLTSEIRDPADSSEFDGREDLTVTLIQMTSARLTRIDEALTRVRNGTYGQCVDCRQSIAERRLRALPFASRCTRCESEREHDARPYAG
jgi:DnaK suppressor protein